MQVEVQKEALQQHDEWDATPLYYAAYSGNKELVKFLLSVGAKCEEKVLCHVCTKFSSMQMSSIA